MTHFFFAAFIVAAALWKAGVPLAPIIAGVSAASLFQLLRTLRTR